MRLGGHRHEHFRLPEFCGLTGSRDGNSVRGVGQELDSPAGLNSAGSGCLFLCARGCVSLAPQVTRRLGILIERTR
jgi:hypothetical protein